MDRQWPPRAGGLRLGREFHRLPHHCLPVEWHGHRGLRGLHHLLPALRTSHRCSHARRSQSAADLPRRERDLQQRRVIRGTRILHRQPALGFRGRHRAQQRARLGGTHLCAAWRLHGPALSARQQRMRQHQPRRPGDHGGHGAHLRGNERHPDGLRGRDALLEWRGAGHHLDGIAGPQPGKRRVPSRQCGRVLREHHHLQSVPPGLHAHERQRAPLHLRGHGAFLPR